MPRYLARTIVVGLAAAAVAVAVTFVGAAAAPAAPAGPAGAAVTSPPPTTTPPPGIAPARTIWEFHHGITDLEWTTAGSAWVDVPGAAVTFVAGPTTTPVFDATYTAESSCAGAGGHCSVRIVAVSDAGPVTELGPAVGLDFAFDSPGGVPQGHAVRRTSDPLPGGATYTVKVQAATTGGCTVHLDDSNLGVTMMT
jgi:hypothetical protein